MSGHDQSAQSAEAEDESRWRHAWSRAFAFVGAAYAIGLLIWCAWWIAADRVPDVFAEGDGALLQLYTLHASRGEWALGPYSRFGWYHPGPFYFYLLVPYYVASGHHAIAMTVGAVAINVAAFAIIAWALCRYATHAMAAAVVGAMVVYLLRVPDVATSAWNPHVLLLPYAALIVAGAVMASGRLGLLPLMALLATFITQTHVGLAPAALAIVACSLLAGVHAHRSLRQRAIVTPREMRTPLIVSTSALVLLVLWLPPLYDQFAPTGTGNLGRLLAFFAESGETTSSRHTFAAWSGTLLQPLMPDFTLAWGGAMPPMPKSPLQGTLAVGEVLLLFAASVWMARRGRRVEAWLCRLCGIASIVAIIAIARIRGGIVDHLTFWNTITGTLDIAVLVGVALVRAGELIPAITRVNRGWPANIVPLACLIATLSLARNGANTLIKGRAELIARESNSAPVGRLYRATRTNIARARLRKPLIEIKGPWADAAGILVQLHKHDIPFGVEHGVAWLYGPPIGERGDEDSTITIADTATAAKLTRMPDECLLDWARDTFIFVRIPTPTPEQYLKLHCAALEIPQP